MDSHLNPRQTEFLSDLVHSLRKYEHGAILLTNKNLEQDFKVLAGLGSIKNIGSTAENSSFQNLKDELKNNESFLFGHFSYNLKNELEKLETKLPDKIGFLKMNFFRPEFLIQVDGENISVQSSSKKTKQNLFDHIPPIEKSVDKEIKIESRTKKVAYLAQAKKIIEHIQRGDIYEINYCIEFFAENISIDPPSLFLKLNALTEAPFAALYKNGEHWLICASPERFIRKKGNKIISQPIKGTRPRGTTAAEDESLKSDLLNDPKEKSENVMIVDLVRNDLSKSAKKGTVKVDELFGIHTFKSVHQMISTVSAELDEKINPVDAIQHAFPMGSMTGAPKIKAMELIDQYEDANRGLYSGAIGYFSPEMDFDFNVVIRSIQYNSTTNYLSFMVGSALTANAIPEKEYAECMLKAKALIESLGATLKTE